MSYRRAWLLVDALDHMFDQVLVRTVLGGIRGGGAQVTEFGGAIAAYWRAEERARLAIREEFSALEIDGDGGVHLIDTNGVKTARGAARQLSKRRGTNGD